MTSFLRLNGITVPVAIGGAGLNPDAIGKMSRAASGAANAGRRLRKGGWKFNTVLRTAAEAIAFRELLAGEGHVVSFDSSWYTSQGMAPVAVGAHWSLSSSGPSPKYGAKCAKSTTDETDLQYAFFDSGSPWTLAWWAYVGAWHHWITNSAGTKWKDGVFTEDAVEGLVSVASGVATFNYSQGNPTAIDDLVALPYLVPSDWPAQIYGFGYAFGLLPALTADGLYIEQNTRVSVLGSDAPTGRVVPVKAAKNFHDFAFELSAV